LEDGVRLKIRIRRFDRIGWSIRFRRIIRISSNGRLSFDGLCSEALNLGKSEKVGTSLMCILFLSFEFEQKNEMFLRYLWNHIQM
jgi:hypothetical protein